MGKYLVHREFKIWASAVGIWCIQGTSNTYFWGPNFVRSLYGQQFRRYRTFYHSPLTIMLNGQKKEQNYLPKIQNFKFHYSFNNFVRDPPQEYTIILWSKSGVSFQRRCRLKLLPLYGPILTKMKKKMVKIQCLKFHNSLSNFGIDPF